MLLIPPYRVHVCHYANNLLVAICFWPHPTGYDYAKIDLQPNGTDPILQGLFMLRLTYRVNATHDPTLQSMSLLRLTFSLMLLTPPYRLQKCMSG